MSTLSASLALLVQRWLLHLNLMNHPLPASIFSSEASFPLSAFIDLNVKPKPNPEQSPKYIVQLV